MDVCSICGQSKQWHTENKPHHPFMPPGQPWDMKVQRQFDDHQQSIGASMRRVNLPLDPVLRQALITKGIITPDDLETAEKLIRNLTGDLNDQNQS